MNLDYFNDVYNESLKAFELNEVPIGAVIVKNNEIIACGYNKKEKDNCCISHAEINAIVDASKKLNNWRLTDCDLYVSLDPCPMCASAIKQARIKNVYSALENTDKKYNEIVYKIFNENDDTNSSINFVSNLDSERFHELLNKFFKRQRNK